ncbi:hypothetical protein [Rhizobium hainanense]|uniref:hypothetical protein n=1 Tax=Rhizobium hainanense TaxID=52131 RepID=UPI001FCCD6D7|nr:hypothetical protein [Rhizobium hainanense]
MLRQFAKIDASGSFIRSESVGYIFLPGLCGRKSHSRKLEASRERGRIGPQGTDGTNRTDVRCDDEALPLRKGNRILFAKAITAIDIELRIDGLIDCGDINDDQSLANGRKPDLECGIVPQGFPEA